MGSPGAFAKVRKAVAEPRLRWGRLILRLPIYVCLKKKKKKKHFGNGERDRKGAPLRRHPFNVRVPGGTKAGVTRVSDLVSIPHKEDWE